MDVRPVYIQLSEIIIIVKPGAQSEFDKKTEDAVWLDILNAS